MHRNHMLLSLICVFFFITGCAEQGPVEEAGEKIDENVESSMDAVDDAIEETEDNAEAAGEAIDDQVDEIKGGY